MATCSTRATTSTFAGSDPGLAHIPAFVEELDAAAIARERVIPFCKPSVRPRGDGARAMLDAEVERYSALGIPSSVQLKTGQLRKLIEAEVEP